MMKFDGTIVADVLHLDRGATMAAMSNNHSAAHRSA
jgi:hypothetical protein